MNKKEPEFIKERTIVMENMFAKGCLVQLSISKWGGAKKINDNQLAQMIDTHEWLTATKKLVDPESLKPICKVGNSARTYLTGISLGCFCAREYALRYPDRFAAAVPIAGGYSFSSDEVPENICNLKNLPLWVFHGEGDTQVQPYQSQVLVDAIEMWGGDVKFTLYPETDHQSTWVKAYDDPALYEWLLAHKK